MQQSLTDLLRQSQTLVDRSAALASDRDMQMRQAVLLLPGLANTRKGNSIYITTTDEGENLLGEQFRQEIDAIYGRLKAAKLPAATVADSVVAGMEENGFVIAAAERKLSVEQLKGLVFAHLGRKMLEESPAAGQK